jgi:hypothetical protein
MSETTMPEPSPDNPVSGEAAQVNTNSLAPADSRLEYEFSAAQNDVINGLANGILWVRLPLLVVGIFQFLIAFGLAFRLSRDGAHIIGILGHGMAGIVCFLLARWLLKAALAFIRVTTTSGRDITNLMTGIRDLAIWFEMLAFFVKLYLALLGVLLILMLIGLFAGAFRGPQ